MIKIDVASGSLFLSVLMVWMHVMSEIKKTLVPLPSKSKGVVLWETTALDMVPDLFAVLPSRTLSPLGVLVLSNKVAAG
ncbi:MAG: hypothetical protein RMX68_031350 [Aulosira sp. ZfuVER01]|nr:hypothetical protein [Aulosira sp. ZfuVER01]MDZ7998325.1 hypothetical protein [Aulosira sp. DedVER01a]MDZ8050102.1 hypothetical protein [Aulosira sp. ZfuCHP01]